MNLEQTLLDGVSHRDGILSRLLGHNQSDRRLAVQTCFCSRLFRSVFRIPNVAELDGISAAAADYQVVKVGRLDYAAHRSDSQFARAFVYASARDFQILSAHGIGHLRNRDVEGAQLVGINPDLNLTRAAADGSHLAHAVDRFDLLFDFLVRDVGNFARRARG